MRLHVTLAYRIDDHTLIERGIYEATQFEAPIVKILLQNGHAVVVKGSDDEPTQAISQESALESPVEAVPASPQEKVAPKAPNHSAKGRR